MLDYAYDVGEELRALVPGQRVSVIDLSEQVPLSTGGVTARPVLLLPGLFENAQMFRRLARELQRAGHPVLTVSGIGRNTMPIAGAARIVADALERADARDVVVLAHSKGALVGKYLMARFDADQRVAGMVAVNAPFAGTVWGSRVRLPSIRILDPADLTVTFLSAPSEVDARIVSLFGTFDQYGSAGGALDGAKNIRLPVAGHSRILGSAALGHTVLHEVSAFPPRGDDPGGPPSRREEPR